MEERKLPLLGDVRDESTEEVRLVLEPKTRGVEPEVLMETMFRATALETRFPLNMNVLDATRTPLVMSLPEVLRAWLDHRHEVLVRRTRHRLAAIERRIEILDGYLLVYLNVDEVIRIIRNEDEPKPRLMRAVQADGYAGRGDPEHAAALAAPARGDGDPQGAQVAGQGAQGDPGAAEGRDAALGAHRRGTGGDAARNSARVRWATRRTELGDAPAVVEVASDAFVEREPITVILSDKGWIRAVKGHIADDAELRFKEGDRLKRLVHCQTTDRLTLFGTNGRAYTLKAADLPRGRGDGQAVRLLAELTNEDDVAALFIADGGRALSGGVNRRARLRRAGGGACRGEAHRQAGAEPEAGRGGGALRAGGWRPCRDHRRQPQAAGLPAGPGAGDGRVAAA